MKIVIISDTHSYHRRVPIPDGDILIHAGDISWRGELEIIADFSNWLADLPHEHKITIFGNHELGMEYGPVRNVALGTIENAGAVYLEDTSHQIGDLLFYGSPYTPRYHDWAFNLDRGKDIDRKWKLIPQETDVLITHGPPYGILDGVKEKTRHPQGCEMLRRRVLSLPKLKAHVFGHLHYDGGKQVKLVNTIFVNAAICDDLYDPCRKPIVIEL